MCESQGLIFASFYLTSHHYSHRHSAEYPSRPRPQPQGLSIHKVQAFGVLRAAPRFYFGGKLLVGRKISLRGTVLLCYIRRSLPLDLEF